MKKIERKWHLDKQRRWSCQSNRVGGDGVGEGYRQMIVHRELGKDTKGSAERLRRTK